MHFWSVIDATTHLPHNDELFRSSTLRTDRRRVAEGYGRRGTTDGRRQRARFAPAQPVARSHVERVLRARYQPHSNQQPVAADTRYAPVRSGGTARPRVSLRAEEGHVVEDGVLEDRVVVWHCGAPGHFGDSWGTAHHPDTSRSVWPIYHTHNIIIIIITIITTNLLLVATT